MKQVKIPTQKIVYSAVFIAIGIILPFFTGQIPSVGSKLLPMHIPILLCGFTLGAPYGILVGFITPLLRSLLFTMPPMYPTAIAMAFELATYGCIAGLMFKALPKKEIFIYIDLIIAMIIGRLVWGLAMLVLLSIKDNMLTWTIFINGAVINALPVIIVQLVLIPILIIALNKAGLIKIDERSKLKEKQE